MPTDTSVPGSTAMIPAPLEEPAPSIIAYATELVLQRGVILRRVLGKEPGYFACHLPDRWTLFGPAPRHEYRLAEAVQLLQLQPVLLTLQDAHWRDRHFLLPAALGPVVEIQVQHLAQSAFSLVPKLSPYARNVAYICEAVAYHCRRLATLYHDLVYFVGDSLPPTGSDDFNLLGAVEPYFEAEALITTIVRAFDTLRFLLWAAYGRRCSSPANFERVVNSVVLPDVLSGSTLDTLRVYKQIKDYRDCIQHYAHFGARLPFARIQVLSDCAMSVWARLPDNPEVKAYGKFDYTGNLDALDFGWRASTAVLEYAVTVVGYLKGDVA